MPTQMQEEEDADVLYADQRPVDPGTVFPEVALRHYISNPIDFIEDVFPNPYDKNQHLVLEDWQRECLTELTRPGGGYVSVRAGSGVGKSFLVPKIIYWFLATRKGVVLCTAPTEHQLSDVIWKGLRQDLDDSTDLQKLFTWTRTKVFMRGYVATWYAVARTAVARGDGKVREGLQGFHDLNVLVIADEASGIEDSAFAALDGALTAPNAMFLMTSNPTRLSGRFYNSQNIASQANGGPWYPIAVSCLNSPYVGDKYIADKRYEHGEDSPVYRSKVLGEFPLQEDTALISLPDFNYFLTGEADASDARAARLFTHRDIIAPAAQRPAIYTHPLFATPEAEMAAHNFLRRVGFRGLDSLTEPHIAPYYRTPYGSA